MIASASRRPRRRGGSRGGLLLETLLALGLFVATGSLVLRVMTDCTRAVRRAEGLATAVDCARSIMAEFDAGLRPIGDLGEGDLGELEAPWSELRVEARGRRSDFEGLVLAEVRVFDDVEASRPRFVLRQLLPARGADLDALDAAFEDRFGDALADPFEVEEDFELLESGAGGAS